MAPSRIAFAVLALIVLPCPLSAVGPRQPVIDMHLHVVRNHSGKPEPACPNTDAIEYAPVDPRRPGDETIPCAQPILSPPTTGMVKEGILAELKRWNVRRAVLSARQPTDLADWRADAPGILIPAHVPESYDDDALARLKRHHAEGRVAIFAEFGPQYRGLSADYSRYDRFWALAEYLDVPVGIHLGEGNPGVQETGSRPDRYRAALTSPFQLEAVLLKHPRLRLYVMHAASPLTDEMIAMLFEYPTLYVDIAANVWNMPRAQFYSQLRRLADAGFSKRIMFGSDPGIWPQAIGIGIRTIEQAPFLSDTQKRDILYNNAARFLRLTMDQIAADHR